VRAEIGLRSSLLRSAVTRMSVILLALELTCRDPHAWLVVHERVHVLPQSRHVRAVLAPARRAVLAQASFHWRAASVLTLLTICNSIAFARRPRAQAR
jgi:hypothetical protein